MKTRHPKPTQKSTVLTREWRQRLKRLAQDPARRKSVSRLLKRWWRDPKYRRQRIAVARRLAQNPAMRARISCKLKERWRDPTYRRKMSLALRRGWQNPARRGRRVAVCRANLGPSIGAQALLAALGAGWVLECWTPAGSVDVAQPAMRMAIEVDDIGHRRPVAKLRDRRKERRLRRLGWTVFRVSEAGCRAAFSAKAVRR